MCKLVSSSSVHGTDMSLHRRLDEQMVLVTAVIVVVNTQFYPLVKYCIPIVAIVFLLTAQSIENRITASSNCHARSFTIHLASFIARQQACIQIAAAIYTQARLRTSLFCFLLYQLSLWVG